MSISLNLAELNPILSLIKVKNMLLENSLKNKAKESMWLSMRKNLGKEDDRMKGKQFLEAREFSIDSDNVKGAHLKNEAVKAIKRATKVITTSLKTNRITTRRAKTLTKIKNTDRKNTNDVLMIIIRLLITTNEPKISIKN